MPLKTILITGCGQDSIGSALAQQFHLRGHTVFASGRSPTSIDPALIAMGCHTLVLDVTSSASISSAAAFLGAATGGKLDILINSAGVLQVMPFADMSVEEARRVFDVNVFGVWAVTQAFLPLLLAARGTIANLCSVNEVFCPPFLAAYNGSKAALEAMSRTLRRELATLGVRVVILKTGSVKSGLFADARSTSLPEGSLYTPIKSWIESLGFIAGARFVDSNGYATEVVDELLKPNVRPIIWRGGLSTVAWLLGWLGWESLLDGQMIKGNQLDTLSPPATIK